MNFNEYQKEAAQTAAYEPVGGIGWIYPALGLSGEVGELVNKLKKVLRDESGVISAEKLAALKRELGDVQWYVAETARQLGLSLQEIAEDNIASLRDRKARGVIAGSGDQR